jgi:signal peptidase I
MKMRPIVKYVLVSAVILAGLWTVGRLTNTLQFFRAPTSANYPSIKPGDRFLASNLISPKRFDLICYYSPAPEFQKQIWVHRLCALEGDKIEIVEGNLFINDKYADSSLSLAHTYTIAASELEKVKSVEKIDEPLLLGYKNDSISITLPDKTILTNSINAKREILPRNSIDEYIEKQYSKKWNQDHFGPIIVPDGKYFVLGDNRNASQDSRYTGFIDKSKYVATVIGK